MKTSKMMKVAGLSLAGFVAVSIGVDRANIGPLASQLAGFCGALAGGWVGSRRRRKHGANGTPVAPPPLPEQQRQDAPSENIPELPATVPESSELD